MLHFYNPWKRQKTCGLLKFTGATEMEHWREMSSRILFHFLKYLLLKQAQDCAYNMVSDRFVNSY